MLHTPLLLQCLILYSRVWLPENLIATVFWGIIFVGYDFRAVAN